MNRVKEFQQLRGVLLQLFVVFLCHFPVRPAVTGTLLAGPFISTRCTASDLTIDLFAG
jgi:hypothetical protein